MTGKQRERRRGEGRESWPTALPWTDTDLHQPRPQTLTGQTPLFTTIAHPTDPYKSSPPTKNKISESHDPYHLPLDKKSTPVTEITLRQRHETYTTSPLPG